MAFIRREKDSLEIKKDRMELAVDKMLKFSLSECHVINIQPLGTKTTETGNYVGKMVRR